MHSITSAESSEDDVFETLPFELRQQRPRTRKDAGGMSTPSVPCGWACGRHDTERMNLAFTAIVSVLVSLCVSSASVAVPQQGANADRRQFEGFSFDLPSGWLPAVPALAKTKADILLGGLRLGAKAEIMVDVGHPTLPSPEAVAEAFAKMWGGTLASSM